LRWESIAIDPLGALLAVLVFDFIITRQSGNALKSVIMDFGSIIFFRAIIGDPPMDSTFRNRSTDEQAIKEIWEILDKHSDTYSTFFLRAIEHAIRSDHKDRPQTIDEWRTMLTDPNVSTQTQWRLATSSTPRMSKAVDIGTKISKKNLIIISVLSIIIITIAGVFLYLN